MTDGPQEAGFRRYLPVLKLLLEDTALKSLRLAQVPAGEDLRFPPLAAYRLLPASFVSGAHGRGLGAVDRPHSLILAALVYSFAAIGGGILLVFDGCGAFATGM